VLKEFASSPFNVMQEGSSLVAAKDFLGLANMTLFGSDDSSNLWLAASPDLSVFFLGQVVCPM